MPCGSGRTLPSEPSMTLGLKPRRDAARPGGHGLRQLDDLQRPGPVRQAADEAALLQCRDQPVDARLGAQVQRFLHFVERRRHAGLLEPFMDEHEKLVLLAGEHRKFAL
jgi:hypothetical protein